MKRSKSIALVMMGASTIILSACGEPEVDAAVYENLQQCIDDPMITRDQCETAFKTAETRHSMVAPKYNSKADCEADFGSERCESAPYRASGGGSIFMPLMMGYMMGSMIGGRSSVVSQPLYRSADDSKNFRTADNRKVGAATGATKVARSATKRPTVKSRTVSRGGFGARGRTFGSARG